MNRKAVMTHMEIKDVKFGKTERKSYAKYQEILQMPNLLKIQKEDAARTASAPAEPTATGDK